MRNNIRGHVGDVDVAAVPCGLGRAIGNKVRILDKKMTYGNPSAYHLHFEYIICF